MLVSIFHDEMVIGSPLINARLNDSSNLFTIITPGTAAGATRGLPAVVGSAVYDSRYGSQSDCHPRSHQFLARASMPTAAGRYLSVDPVLKTV